MKTPWLVGMVVVAHGIAVGSVVLMQGCGTVQTVEESREEPIMPQTVEEDTLGAFPGRRSGSVPEVKSWPTETTTYVVARGDSLSRIARRYGVTMAEVMALNGIRNPDVIRIGQKLSLPGNLDIKKSAPPPRRRVAPKVAVSGPVYVVKSGDSLSRISVQKKVSVRAIKEANGLTSDRILVGQKLVIPGAKVEVAPPKRVTDEPVKVSPDDPSATDPVPVKAPAANVKAQPKTDPYQVQEGDTLRSIAMQNALGVSELRRINSLPADAEVTPGQILQLPMPE